MAATTPRPTQITNLKISVPTVIHCGHFHFGTFATEPEFELSTNLVPEQEYKGHGRVAPVVNVHFHQGMRAVSVSQSS